MTSTRMLSLRAQLIASATLTVGISACGSEVNEVKRGGAGGDDVSGQGGAGGTLAGPQTGPGGGLGGAGQTGQGGFGGAGQPDPVQSCYTPEVAGDCVAAEDAAGSLPPQDCSDTVVLSGPEVVEGACCYLVEPGDPSNCVAGRPFVVEGEARRAPLSQGASPWSDIGRARAAVARIHDVPPSSALRFALADAWALDALAEHASIASFAQTALGWLAAGAPPDLVTEAHRAAMDEIAHARAAFAVASAYAGASLAPGAIDVRGAGSSARLVDLAVSAAVEGCVEEALAAALVEARAAHCEVAEIADLLRSIADDEARHAALSFRFVAWAIEHGGPGVRDAVADAVRVALKKLEAGPAPGAMTVVEAELAREGVLSGALLLIARRRALSEVVRPALDALLSAQQAPSLRA